ncbi:hypothetical protein BD311DRAFT_3203 [Dichomitus squalens]|uniref:Uncharacterized protein n=1 Tax=Dichomitus squalens TaxID=114155 RepID=A0A4Q9N4B5_9APHY|nr:hypothetical protein BD311DRAFT_3203 [Dichomitus squalens]
MTYNAPPPSYDELYNSQHASTSSSSSTSSMFGSLKQSLASFTMVPSKVDLEILPFDSIDMYGQPDKDAAYSLSGQTVVKLVPPTSWFCSETPQGDECFLLESLVVTFEGQSELVAPQTGYASCRLIEFSKELITEDPIVIRHSWSEDATRNPAQWYVTFNLNIPGWLPPTCGTSYGNSTDEPEVSYRLSAVAKYREDRPAQPSSWRTACYGYMSLPTTQMVKARGVDVTINRFTIPPPQCTLAGSELPEAPFRSVEYIGTMTDAGSATVPSEILSKLRMRATVPEHIPMDAGSFPLLLKVRPDGLSADERKRLHMPGFLVSVVQNEIIRASMSAHYAQEWPVPPASEQPPNRPIRTRRHDSREYECGMIFSPAAGTSATRSYSLLHSGFAGKFELDESKANFQDERFEQDDTWIRVRVDVPFRDILVEPHLLPQYEDHPLPKLRPSERGPIMTVYHRLEISLACAYDLPEDGATPGKERALDELKFTIPLSFVRVPRSGPHCPRTESFTEATGSPLSTTSPAGSVRMLTERVPLPQLSQPYAQSLPAYNTLYHKNGARIEDPTPLPVYTKDGGREHPLETSSEQRVEEAEPPAMTICKQTPLHKAVVYSTPPLPRL